MDTTRVITSNQLSERDPARRPCVDVEMPKDCRRVWSGAVKRGDMFLSALAIEEGKARWLFVEDLDSQADDYLCLVRPDNAPVEEACERCHGYAKQCGYCYCGDCYEAVAQAGRSA